METLPALAILVLALPFGAAHAQSCQNVGNSTFCSDGSSVNRVGNTTFINPPPPTDTPPTNQYQPVQPSRVCSRIGQTTICN
jgi:hypothetical protein